MESATVLLTSLGCLVEIKGQGDHLATYSLPDRQVQILYHDEKVKDHDKKVKNYPQFDYGL